MPTKKKAFQPNRLKGFCLLVGMTGFEPATSRPPGERATGLRYIPKILVKKTAHILSAGSIPFRKGTQRNKLFSNHANYSCYLSWNISVEDRGAFRNATPQRKPSWEGASNQRLSLLPCLLLDYYQKRPPHKRRPFLPVGMTGFEPPRPSVAPRRTRYRAALHPENR